MKQKEITLYRILNDTLESGVLSPVAIIATVVLGAGILGFTGLAVHYVETSCEVSADDYDRIGKRLYQHPEVRTQDQVREAMLDGVLTWSEMQIIDTACNKATLNSPVSQEQL